MTTARRDGKSPVRVVLADIGTSGDSAMRLARLLRDDGHEVIHLGELGAPVAEPADRMLHAALQEDAAAVGLVGTGGDADDPGTCAGQVNRALAAAGACDVAVFCVTPARSDAGEVPGGVVTFTAEELDRVATWVRSGTRQR